ncbi:apoptosis-antagonizing transcription factor [Butyriboletus roseoflavus]|nr:apoptosis-antagonizing transcription factor [Butyriboletus roseoflavus]
MERLSLAQQIAQLEDVAPVDFDPEDAQVTGINPGPDLDTVAENDAVRAHYFDVGPSSMRTLHESLSDPKYDGAKTSRKVMLDESDGSESDSTSEDAESGSHVSEVHLEPRNETGVKRQMDIRTTKDASTERHSAPIQNSDLSSNLRKIREEDRKKGKAISRQIASHFSSGMMSFSLYLASRHSGTHFLMLAFAYKKPSQLETAFLLQPLQDAANQQTLLVKMLKEARLLSNEIFDFQERLLSANESIQPPPRKRRRSTETYHSVAEYAEELREVSHAASELECTYHPHLVQTLNKWSSKIQAVAPSVLLPSNRNAFSRTTQHIKSAPQLIDETLADYSKVLLRTRIYRGKGSRLGISTMDEEGAREKEDAEVFDDTDFYHQLLRDIIDGRGNGTGGNDDWIAMQKEKKAKKKVDTKASKGRKLRYEVHEKIQNFMVPVPTQGSWHEEQIDELFASLLGKGFENAMQEVGEIADESLQEEENVALLEGGFRVFG